MATDSTMPDKTRHHNDGAKPYACYTRPSLGKSAWALDHGKYCRHSLDELCGVTDPRCPADCPHKAPESVVAGFGDVWSKRGARAAADWVRTWGC